MLLDVPTVQGHELHLEVSRLQEPVLLMDLFTLQRPVLPPDLSTPQGPELHLDVSVQKDSLLVWTCLPVSTSVMTLSLMTSFKPGFMTFEYF